MAGQQTGGYESDFVEEVPKRYICNICTKPLRDPELTVCCGQHYCQSCLNQWLKKHRPQSCPHCRAGMGFQHVVDKSKNREIMALKVRCDNKQEGCEWTGELGSLKTHLESESGCGYVQVGCPNKCYEKDEKELCKMKRKDLDRHLREDCFHRQYQCEHCGKKDKYVNITGKGRSFTSVQYHYQECPEMKIQCPNKCGKEFKRKENKNHRNQCPLETVQCPNKCKIKRSSGKEITTEMLRKDLDRHLKERCYLRPYKCKHCDLESTYEAITGNGINKKTSHYESCQEYPLPCPNHCGAIRIKRKDMEDHRSHCPEETVPCPNMCKAKAHSRGILISSYINNTSKMLRKDLGRHLKDECYLRPYKCEHCNLESTYEVITSHYKSCQKYPLACLNKCGRTRIMRMNMTTHFNECPLQPVECPFAEAGCTTKPARQDLEKHTSTMQQQHLLMVMGAFKGMKDQHKQELQRTKNEAKTKTTQIEQLLRQTREELSGAKTQLTQTEQELNTVSERLATTEQQLTDMEERLRARRGFFRNN